MPICLYRYMSCLFFGIFCAFLSFTPKVWAGIYQCLGPSGVMEYRDRPCQSSSEDQQFVPIQYHRTNEKQVKKQMRDLEVLDKELTQKQKQETTMKTKALKQTKAQKLKNERLQRKCTKLSEKIDKIESQLRAGCKINKANRLREQLEACQATKEEICSYE